MNHLLSWDTPLPSMFPVRWTILRRPSPQIRLVEAGVCGTCVEVDIMGIAEGTGRLPPAPLGDCS